MTDITTAVPAASAGPGISTARGRASLGDSYETFLALLTTQLKNQDPLSPLDSNQFTQQIVQMTGVEQQLLTNDLLQALVDRGGGSVGEAVSYIGRTVTADSNAARLADGQAEWSYELPRQAAGVELEIRNAAGTVVWRGDAPARTPGAHAFAWDGKDMHGNALPNGTYRLSATAQDTAAAAVPVNISVRGVVTGVEQGPNGPILITAAGEMPLSAVRRVVMATPS